MTTVELPRHQLVIDGRRVEAASGHRYDSIDPYLGATLASAADGDAADVDLAVARPGARWPGRGASSPGSGGRLGDPKAADTEMGPVATEPQYREVLLFLEEVWVVLPARLP